jgi:hypothetical protein
LYFLLVLDCIHEYYGNLFQERGVGSPPRRQSISAIKSDIFLESSSNLSIYLNLNYNFGVGDGETTFSIHHLNSDYTPNKEGSQSTLKLSNLKKKH